MHGRSCIFTFSIQRPLVRLAAAGERRRDWNPKAPFRRQRLTLEVVAMPGSVIVAGARTPIGKLAGAFASLSATDLGGVAIAAALARAGITGEQVQHVIMGQVLLAGAGQLPARQAAVKGGIPLSVPSTIINKVCLSGLNAIIEADRMIAVGDADIVVAGGMESMTNAPYLLADARGGMRIGD